MVARFGPWIAAAAMGLIALASGLAIAQLVPVRFRATGNLQIPAAALRSLEPTWPDASQVNRWLVHSGRARPEMNRVEHADRQGGKRLVFTAQASTGEAAAVAVNRALDAAQADLLSQGDHFARERHRSLLTLLHHARAERTRVQRQLDQLISQRLQATVSAVEPAPPSPPVVATPGQAPVTRRNPLWDDLARQVGELEGRRAGLLLTMTEAHPVVRDLDWRLGQLREQLRMSQEFTTAQVPPAAHPSPTMEPAVAPPAKPAPANYDQSMQRLRQQVVAADKQLGQAVQQERAAWQELSTLQAELQNTVTSAAVPTQAIDGVQREKIRWSAAVLALGLAAATLRMLQPRRKLLKSVADVQRQLGVPVIGKLSLR